MSTKAALFVIESRNIKEEAKGKRQGLILTEIMALLGVKTEYRYIRTIKELDEMVRQYYKSDFRYLHFAMHGVVDKRDHQPLSKFSLSLEQIPYSGFCKILNMDAKKNGKRRIFISACNVLSDITCVFKNHNNLFISIIAPSENIKISLSSLFWATFYREMFTIKKSSMVNENIKKKLNKICDFYGLKFKGYFKEKNSSDYEDYDFPKIA